MFSHSRRLRWSGETLGYEIDISAIGGAPVDPGVPGGRELIHLVDTFFAGPAPDQAAARQAVIDTLGPEAFFDAAAVFGNFEMMNRVAEGTGIGVAPQKLKRDADLMNALGLDRIRKSQQRD